LISPFAFFDSAAMRLPSLPHALLLAASAAPFCRLICDHLLCPDMRAFYTRSCPQVYPLEIHHFWRFARCARFFLYGSISVSMYLTVRRSPSRRTGAIPDTPDDSSLDLERTQVRRCCRNRRSEQWGRVQSVVRSYQVTRSKLSIPNGRKTKNLPQGRFFVTVRM